MKPKVITLFEHERIVAVVPEYCAGPGWANAPTWVHIVNSQTKEWREECIQPEERTERLHVLFNLGAAMHQSLGDAVPIKRSKKK
jgi:hypothetical protein